MHRPYFPACPVAGPIDPPVPYGHMVKHGAIPKKCSDCPNCFEGGCTRFFEEVQRHMHLDFGPCGIDGPTDPVVYEDKLIVAKVEIPRKCARCRFLLHKSIYGFTCRKDQEKWGDCYRGLDWGAWSPDRIYIELPHPKLTTKTLVDAVHSEDLIGFIAEHRRISPGISMAEAKEDYSMFRSLITQRAPTGIRHCEQDGGGQPATRPESK